MISDIVVRYFPITVFLLLCLFSFGKRKPVSFPFSLSLVVCFIVITAIAALPDDYSIDKPRYVAMFHSRFYWGVEDYRDMGWMLYVTFCSWLFQDNVFVFFLLTATIYCVSYLVFARQVFESKAFYFFVMSMGCLGFMNYATNTIRAGFAISFLLLGIASEKKPWAFVLLLFSFMMHRSMIIPIAGYMVSLFVNNLRVCILFWIACLVISVSNIGVDSFVDIFKDIDYRVEYYSDTSGGPYSSYKVGFRWDFLIYSVLPLLFSLYSIYKLRIEDDYFSRIVKMYMLVNAIWLLAIRIAFTDRIAYLSWFLIPLMTLYPIVKYPEKYGNANALALGIMGLFMGLNIVLMFV